MARRLRQTAPFAERVLWTELRKLQINIRRQVPIGPYVVDFAHHGSKVVIEIDGPLHALPENAGRDAIRQAWLENEGFRVVRFGGQLAADSPELVAQQIQAEIVSPPSPALPPSQGEGRHG